MCVCDKDYQHLIREIKSQYCIRIEIESERIMKEMFSMWD